MKKKELTDISHFLIDRFIVYKKSLINISKALSSTTWQGFLKITNKLYNSMCILMVVLLLPISYASDYVLEIQNYPYEIKDWRWGAYFNPPYIIIINGYMFDDGVFNEKMYRNKLSHEIAHALCWKWFKNLHCNDERWKQEHCERNWCI